MITPCSNGYTIYTKYNCVYCERAKQLLHNENVIIIQVEEHFNDYQKFIDFIRSYTKQEYRTFPMIFYDGDFIGGFDQTIVHYENQKKYSFDDNF